MKITNLHFCISGLICWLTFSYYLASDVSAQRVPEGFLASKSRKKITFDNKSNVMISLSDALEQIYKKHQLRIASNQGEIGSFSVDANILNVSSDKALKMLQEYLKDKNYELKQLEKSQFIISKRSDLAEQPLENERREDNKLKYGNVFALIKGRVLDVNSLPLPNATVRSEQSKGVASTDQNGNFQIVASVNETLIFSAIGFMTQRVLIEDDKVYLKVVLKEEDKKLDEVVVVGYGTQSKRNVTGSIVSMSGSTINNMPVSNVSNALAGRLAGLVVLSPSGLPGVGSSIRVRGTTSYGGQDPLYVIDDIPRTKQEFDLISPNDIASISVLKDGAAAIYGVRGGSGVVMITTKQGMEGDAKFNFSLTRGTSDPTRVPRRLNSYEDVLYRNNYYLNQGVPAGDPRYYAPDEIEFFKSGKINTDIFDQISKTPKTLDANLSVTGGTPNAKYYVATGYLQEKGLFDKLESKRYNILSNLDFKFSNDFAVKINLQGTIRPNSTPWWFDGVNTSTLSDLTRAAMNFTPLSPGYVNGLPDGSLYHLLVPEVIKNGYINSNRTNLNGYLKVSYNPSYAKGLGADVSYNYNKQMDLTKTRYKPYKLYLFNTLGTNNHIIGDQIIGIKAAAQQPFDFYQEAFSQRTVYVFNANLRYNKTFKDHDLGVQVFYEQSESTGDDFSAKGENLLSSNIDQLFFANSDPARRSISGGGIEFGRSSVFGRLNYKFKGKYLIEGLLRADASSAFAPKNKWGYFPSVSAAWILSDESFIKKLLPKVDNFKLRASYGILGYDDPAYVALSQWYSFFSLQGSAVFNSPVNTIAPQRYPNADIRWQRIATTNIGMDASFYNGLISGTLDVFYKKTTDLLVANPTTVPTTFGTTLAQINYGQVNAHGIELTLRHDNKIGQVQYYAGVNFAYTTNKVIKYPEQAGIPDYQRRTGRPVNFLTGYQSDGIIRNNEQLANYLAIKYGTTAFQLGDIGFQDLGGPNNGGPDGIVNANDNVVLSNLSYDPRINYGIPVGASWKGFDVSILLQGVGMRKVMLTDRAQWQEQAPLAFWADFWSPENTNAAYPKIGGLNGTQSPNSSFWLRSGNYLRFKSAEIGYSLPLSFTKKLGMSACRLFANGNNLFIISDDIKMYDPEYQTDVTGYGAFQYPLMRTISIGATVSF
jgi:TonB-linked SusC/RagA family outer membrane protein